MAFRDVLRKMTHTKLREGARYGNAVKVSSIYSVTIHTYGVPMVGTTAER